MAETFSSPFYAYHFVESWGVGGVAGLHVGPCLASDLYAAYTAWVNKNGEAEVAIEKFVGICKGSVQKAVTAKLEWVLSRDGESQIEAVVVRPINGCLFSRGAKESLARYTGRSVHAFADVAASGAFSLDFPPRDEDEQE